MISGKMSQDICENYAFMQSIAKLPNSHQACIGLYLDLDFSNY